MPFARRLRTNAAVHDPDRDSSRLPPGAALNPVGRSVVDIDSGRWWGIDVAVDNPEIRTGADDGIGVWSARDLLTEIGDRRDLIDINAGLLTMALRAVATADVGADPAARDEAGRAVVAVHPRFAADDDFLPTVKTAVRRSGLDACQLLLSVAAAEVDALWPAVQRLRSHGVKVALEVGAGSIEETDDLLHRLSFDLVRLPANAALSSEPTEVDAAHRPGDTPAETAETPAASASVASAPARGESEPGGGSDGPPGPEPTALLRNLLANSRRVWVEDVTEWATLDELRCVGCSLVSGPVVDHHRN